MMGLVIMSVAFGGHHSGRGGGFAKAPGSAITIDWSIIYRRFYEKTRVKITLYQKKGYIRKTIHLFF
jgi:hypothetical protein